MADVKQVPSSMMTSTKPIVTVKIKGAAEVAMKLRLLGKQINVGMDSAIFRVANFLQREIQMSIIGLRNETKSVDTGILANSIVLDKLDKSNYLISPQGFYPNGTKVSDVATFLEYGTEKLVERRHFRNSLARNEVVMREEVSRFIAKTIASMNKRTGVV
jgi:hypothetical protein